MNLPPYLRAAKSRDWTDAEVTEAAAFVQRERPDVWAELEELERTTRDLTGSLAAYTEMGLLLELHPECELNEITELFSKVRDIRIKSVRGTI